MPDIKNSRFVSLTIFGSLLALSTTRIEISVIGASGFGFARIIPFSAIVGLSVISAFSLNPPMLARIMNPVTNIGMEPIAKGASTRPNTAREPRAAPMDIEPMFPEKTLAGYLLYLRKEMSGPNMTMANRNATELPEMAAIRAKNEKSMMLLEASMPLRGSIILVAIEKTPGRPRAMKG